MMRTAPLAGVDVATAAQLACLLEVSVPKPGNVSLKHGFVDAGYEEFLASAAAIGTPLGAAGGRPLGETVRLAIEATTRWTRSNTNLGIVLLLAPIARAALTEQETDLRGAVRRVLDRTTVADARNVYAAIRLASPGGLGRVEQQDVAQDPDVTLLDAMRLAAGRDAIAREYTTGFDTTFETGVPALQGARRDGLSWSDAIVETFLTLLAGAPDTHIARRVGTAHAQDVSRCAHMVLRAGGVRTTAGRNALDELDRMIRNERNSKNPGATADLTAAAIFVVLLTGGWTQSSRA